jgi:hypothetical protein
MNYEEFQRHIGKAGLKLYEFAHLMGMNPTSVTNKRARGVPRHLAVIAVHLGEMADRGIDFHALLARNDIVSVEYPPSGTGKKDVVPK